VKRVPGFVRSRAGRLAVAAAVVVVGVFTAAAPAYAHHSVLSGSTECYDGEHVVTWSIQAVSVVHLPMTIVSATATNNGNTYAVTGYTSPVNDGETTSATSVLPAGSTGDVTLHVYVTWPDDVDYTVETSVPADHHLIEGIAWDAAGNRLSKRNGSSYSFQTSRCSRW